MVRPELAEQLLAVLRRVTDVPALAYRRPPEELTGGFWAELVSFSPVGAPHGWEGELVARLMPEPSLALKETIVQRAVAVAGVRTPIVRAAGGPDDGLGCAYMIVDRAAGAQLLEGLGGVGMLIAAPRLARQIPEALASSMAELHAVDPAPIRGELDVVMDVARSVDELLAALRADAAQHGRSDLVAVGDWLTAHPPPARRRRLPW